MDPLKLPKMIAFGVLGLFFFLFFMGTYFSIDAGERGVVLRFGAVNRVAAEGIHFKLPFIEEIVRMTA